MSAGRASDAGNVLRASRSAEPQVATVAAEAVTSLQIPRWY
jgi:hypothetical protein